MIIKDLVVTGIVKFLRHVNIDTLVAEKINSVTKEEIGTLKGTTSNIQNQLSVIDKSVEDASIEQTNFKSNIANAINKIPRNPNTSPLTSSSGLSQFVSELGEIEHGPDVSGVTATATVVRKGYKFIDGKWQEVVGAMRDIPNGILIDSGAGIYVDYDRNVSTYIKLDGSLGTFDTPKNIITLSVGSSYGEQFEPGYRDEYAGDMFGYLDGAWGTSGERGSLKFKFLAEMFGNANTNEVLAGKTFTSNIGAKVKGTMANIPDYTRAQTIGEVTRSSYYDSSGTAVSCVSKKFIYHRIPRTGYFVTGRDLIYEASAYGNAYHSCVREGYTFTSQVGLQVRGTLADMPDYYYSPNAPLNFRRKTEYYDMYGNSHAIPETNFISVYYDTNDIDDDGDEYDIPFVINNSNHEIMMLASRFGDASTGDVVEGKIFTSNDGLALSGALKNYGAITRAVSAAPNAFIYIRINPGVYKTNAGTGYPEIELRPDNTGPDGGIAFNTKVFYNSGNTYNGPTNASFSLNSNRIYPSLETAHASGKLIRFIFASINISEDVFTINFSDGTVVRLGIISVYVDTSTMKGETIIYSKDSTTVKLTFDASDSNNIRAVVSLPSGATLTRSSMNIWMMWN